MVVRVARSGAQAAWSAGWIGELRQGGGRGLLPGLDFCMRGSCWRPQFGASGGFILSRELIVFITFKRVVAISDGPLFRL